MTNVLYFVFVIETSWRYIQHIDYFMTDDCLFTFRSRFDFFSITRSLYLCLCPSGVFPKSKLARLHRKPEELSEEKCMALHCAQVHVLPFENRLTMKS